MKRKLEIWNELLFYVQKEDRIKGELKLDPDNFAWKQELARTSQIIEELFAEYRSLLEDS